MGDIHYFQPIVAHGLERRNSLAHAVDQDLSAAARDRPESRCFEIRNDFFQRFAKHFSEMNELAWTEPVNIDLREPRFDVRQKVQVPLLSELGMMTALHQNLRST